MNWSKCYWRVNNIRMEEIKIENGNLPYISVIEMLRKYSPLFTPPITIA